jgi:4-hydroxy-tetrahydrodipicolinate reductase
MIEVQLPVRVAVVGAMGRMGREVLRALTSSEGFEVVLAIDHNELGRNAREVLGPKAPDVVIEQKLGAALDRVAVDVVVDFTHHSAAAQHAASAMKRGAAPVIGTTGMSEEDLRELVHLSKEHNVPGLYAPNFAIGAVLMMKFAEMAAQWIPDVEIIELHHDQKQDAPSGTAMLTAERIAHGRSRSPRPAHTLQMRVEGVRGGRWHETPIHSVRLPGFVAHQEVVFGSPGETLVLRHDSTDRTSFMSGVKLAVREVRNLERFVVGMDELLFRD